VQLPDLDVGLGGQLRVRRRSVEPQGQRVLRARQLALVAYEVDRQLDRPGLGVHAALHGLPDPPSGVRREAVALAPVELLHGADQPEDALLDEVEQRELGALVLLRDGDDEPQVRVDHALLGHEVAALDPLREVDLLRRRQQPVAADLVEEELERVRGGGRELHLVQRALLHVAPAVVAQLDPARVERLVQRAQVGVVEIERLRQLVDLRELEAAVGLGAVEQRAERPAGGVTGRRHTVHTISATRRP
jgi:hypothetical protein